MHNQAYFFVYRITCKNNNKSYIGITNDPKRRFKERRYDARTDSKYPIHAAMRKHGIDQFEFEVIYGSRDEAYIREEMEKYFVTLYDSKNNGYNCTDGGEGIQGYKPEWIEKMRKVGANISEETRQKRSESAKSQWADHKKRAVTQQAITEAYADPNQRKRLSEAASKRWADPAFKAKVAASYTAEKRSKASLGKRAVDWKVTNTMTGDTIIVHNLKNWCETNHLKFGAIRQATHRGASSQGYTCVRA
jgi:group I intron endonuclease